MHEVGATYKVVKFCSVQKFFFSALLLLCIVAPANSNNAPEDTIREPFNAGDLIIGKAIDNFEWDIAKVGDSYIALPLPIILIYDGRFYFFLSSRFEHGKASYKGFGIGKTGSQRNRIIRVLDDGVTPDPNAGRLWNFSISKAAFSGLVSALLLCLVFVWVGKQYTKMGPGGTPKGFCALVEIIIIFVLKSTAFSSISHKYVHRFLPYLLSLFFFIFFSNILSLVPFFPGGVNITGNISVTFVLAMFTFFTTQFLANKGYWKHIFNTPGVPVFLKFPIPLMPIIELVGVFIKPFVLMIRLFANMTAGFMSILGFVCLIFVLGEFSTFAGFLVSPLVVFFLIFMNFLKILVAFLQAYVFTLFSAMFFGMAVPDDHH